MSDSFPSLSDKNAPLDSFFPVECENKRKLVIQRVKSVIFTGELNENGFPITTGGLDLKIVDENKEEFVVSDKRFRHFKVRETKTGTVYILRKHSYYPKKYNQETTIPYGFFTESKEHQRWTIHRPIDSPSEPQDYFWATGITSMYATNISTDPVDHFFYKFFSCCFPWHMNSLFIQHDFKLDES